MFNLRAFSLSGYLIKSTLGGNRGRYDRLLPFDDHTKRVPIGDLPVCFGEFRGRTDGLDHIEQGLEPDLRRKMFLAFI